MTRTAARAPEVSGGDGPGAVVCCGPGNGAPAGPPGHAERRGPPDAMEVGHVDAGNETWSGRGVLATVTLGFGLLVAAFAGAATALLLAG